MGVTRNSFSQFVITKLQGLARHPKYLYLLQLFWNSLSLPVYMCCSAAESCVLAEQSQCMGSAGQMWVSFLLQNKTLKNSSVPF
jgi:hypothetical protein